MISNLSKYQSDLKALLELGKDMDVDLTLRQLESEGKLAKEQRE